MTGLKEALRVTALQMNELLDELLVVPEGLEAQVTEAMRYAALAPGKRIRPFLVVSCARLFDVSHVAALRVAAAIELVHTYSLVHDDLPSMDDDHVRRGQPAVHIHFDEATAVLAGDALLTLAFEILASDETSEDAEVRCELVRSLAIAAGNRGMVGGQMMDLLGEHSKLDIDTLTRLQRLKTGAIIGIACESGAILANAAQPMRRALHDFAYDLGLAYQIVDDLLDVEGREAMVGKAVRKDMNRGKASFIGILGRDQARRQAEILAHQATGHLEQFGEKADILRDVAIFVINRKY